MEDWCDRMTISNSQIRKLGDRIRIAECDRKKCAVDDIKLLQAYRLEHKDSLIHVFDVVSKISKRVHRGRMVAFRLKKIDTILSKLRRSEAQGEGKMELDRMWDVAGCRVIVQSENAIYRIVDLLFEEFEIKRPKDYIKNPAKDGYQGYHLYVKPKKLYNPKVVEIQLRTMYQHHWATLVEVIDVVYDTKIKEGDNSLPELNTFLKTYSNWHKVTTRDKEVAILTENQHNIYSRLSEVFTDNILELRSDWINLREYGQNEPYILFNVDQDSKKVSFKTFKTIEEAEEHYLNDFIRQEGDFMVARLNVEYFVQLAFVYANYVLSNHRFLDVWLGYLLDFVKDNESDSGFVINQLVSRIQHYKSEVLKAQMNEAELIDFFESQPVVDGRILKQLKKWKDERDSDLINRRNTLNQIDEEIEKIELLDRKKRREAILWVVGIILIVGIVVLIIKLLRRR